MNAAALKLDKLKTDKPTQTAQQSALKKLDDLIARLEEERKQRGRGNGFGKQPAQDSVIMQGPGGMGALHADRKRGKAMGRIAPQGARADFAIDERRLPEPLSKDSGALLRPAGRRKAAGRWRTGLRTGEGPGGWRCRFETTPAESGKEIEMRRPVGLPAIWRLPSTALLGRWSCLPLAFGMTSGRQGRRKMHGSTPSGGRQNHGPAAASRPAECRRPHAAVYMLDADRFDGSISGLKDGQLSINADPPRHRAVRRSRSDRRGIRRFGDGRLDRAGQSRRRGNRSAPQAGNGIQDIHLECRGIAIGRVLQQIVISGAFGGEARVWMFNLNNTPFWKLENIRPNNSTTTNWYIEPPPVDCYDQSFDVMLTFADNSTFKTRIKATTHTDAKLKADKQTPEAAAKPAEGGPLVMLAGDETVRGRSIEIDGETLIVQAATGGELQIPMAEVRGIWLGGNNAPQQRKRFDERLKSPGQSDWVMIRAKDKEAGKEGDKEEKGKDGGAADGANAGEGAAAGEGDNQAEANANNNNNNPNAGNQNPNNRQRNNRRNNRKGPENDAAADRQVAGVEGSVQSISVGKLSLLVGQETRKVALGRVVGIVMAAHAAAPRQETFRQLFELASGEKMAGQLAAIKDDALTIHTRYGDDVQLPRGEVKSITCRGGKATYLSDLEPASVEEVAYFERPLGYRRDQGLLGGPLAVRGTTYRKGLAVHSRCVLTYALDGHYELFHTRLGFEDGAPVNGSISCRVLADDRELYNNATFRADTDPVSLKLDLAGAKQLVLEVDFGEMQNVGDRIVWGAARVVRPADSAAAPAASTPTPSAAAAATPTAVAQAQPVSPADAAPQAKVTDEQTPSAGSATTKSP